MGEIGDKFEELVGIMHTLRKPGGCPWDREQTFDSLKEYVIEETYEVVDAIDAHDLDELRGELGDLMLQIVFQSELAEEQGDFDIKDVIEGISTKLIRRHPHVFGDTSVAGADEVVHRWEQIKRGEKGYEHRTSILDGVPRQLPALMLAMEISKRAAKAGFEWPRLDAVVDKLDEEVQELKAELHQDNRERISEELGDLLFTVVNIARWTKVHPEDALRAMTNRFSTRFRHIEAAANGAGKTLEEMSIEEMDAAWDQAKRETTEVPD
jgi:tetrapyrrole methylase family protein/MazG family protein